LKLPENSGGFFLLKKTNDIVIIKRRISPVHFPAEQAANQTESCDTE